MKRWILLVFLTLSCVSQEATPKVPVAEPQYLNEFYALGADGQLVALEHQNAVFKSHVKSFVAYATVKSEAELTSAHAPIRLSSNVQLVVKGRLPLDPASRFELRPLEVKGKHREIVLTKGHGSIAGASATSSFDEPGIPLHFEEYGEASYRFAPEKPLVPGEYAISVKGAITNLYCFGVDK